MTNSSQYWLVGAYWDNKHDMTDAFVSGGFWRMGWGDQQQPDYALLRDQMRPEDRIAIKARGGRGKAHMIIKAIGIILAVDPYEKRVYVDWKLADLNRKVESKGKFSTIHPPLSYPTDADWIHEIFTL